MLLDTSGLFAYLIENEASHEKAKELFTSHPRSVVHSLVIAEFVALGNTRRISRESILNFIMALLNNPRVEMVWIEKQPILQALAFLGERLDKTYSLCDAVSFQLMKQRGIDEAFSTDRHFEQEGFKALLR